MIVKTMKKSLLMVLLMAGMLVVPAGLTLNPMLSAAQAARPSRPGWNVAVKDDDPVVDKSKFVNLNDIVIFNAGDGVNIDMNSVPGAPDPSGEGRIPPMHTITISAVPPAEYYGWTLKANDGTDGEALIQDYWFVNFKNGDYTSVTVAPSEENEATSDVTIDLNDKTKQLLAGLGEGSDNCVTYDDPEAKDKVTLGGVEATEPVALTNVKEGGLSADSTDAVNGSQLFETNEKVAENTAAREKMETEGVWKVSAKGGTAEPVKLGEQVDLAGDKNIAVSLDPASVNGKFHALKLQLSKNLDLSETGSVTMGGTVVNNEGLTIAGGPSVTQKGIDAGGKRITNVAPGQDDSDAATLGQVKELAGGMGGFVTPRLDEMDRRIDSVGAMAAAFSAMIPLDYDEEHPTQVSVGFGHYSGENAIAFGVMHYANRDLLFNAGVAICHDEKSFRAGATFRLGESPEAPSAIEAGKTVRVSTTEIALMRRVEAQDAALADQQRQIQALIERLEKLAPAN